MADNLSAVEQIVTLFVDAFNDTAHAFGQGKGASSLSSYANLLPDVMGIISQVGELPGEIKGLDVSNIDTILSLVEQKLQIPNQKAESIVQAVLAAIGHIADAATAQGTAVEAAFRQQAG